MKQLKQPLPHQECHSLDLGKKSSGPIQNNLPASHPALFGSYEAVTSSSALAEFPFIKWSIQYRSLLFMLQLLVKIQRWNGRKRLRAKSWLKDHDLKNKHPSIEESYRLCSEMKKCCDKAGKVLQNKKWHV